jgi:serine protease Do
MLVHIEVRIAPPGGKAAKSGIRRGDVLLRADREIITSPRDLKDALAKARKQGRKSVTVLVRRGDVQQFSTLPIA